MLDRFNELTLTTTKKIEFHYQLLLHTLGSILYTFVKIVSNLLTDHLLKSIF